MDDRFALALYRQAQTLDQWGGQAYEGTSVIAGAKAVQQRGYIGEYRWAFSLSELVLALGYQGPVVLGINWYSGMDPDDKGYLHVSGSLSGGHAILANGVSLKTESVLLRNSWGRDWGVNGSARISFTDLERLLHEDGECCVPVGRRWQCRLCPLANSRTGWPAVDRDVAEEHLLDHLREQHGAITA